MTIPADDNGADPPDGWPIARWMRHLVQKTILGPEWGPFIRLLLFMVTVTAIYLIVYGGALALV